MKIATKRKPQEIGFFVLMEYQLIFRLFNFKAILLEEL